MKKNFKSKKDDIAVELFQLKKSGWTVSKSSDHSVILTFAQAPAPQMSTSKKQVVKLKPRRSF